MNEEKVVSDHLDFDFIQYGGLMSRLFRIFNNVIGYRSFERKISFLIVTDADREDSYEKESRLRYNLSLEVLKACQVSNF